MFCNQWSLVWFYVLKFSHLQEQNSQGWLTCPCVVRTGSAGFPCQACIFYNKWFKCDIKLMQMWSKSWSEKWTSFLIQGFQTSLFVVNTHTLPFKLIISITYDVKIVCSLQLDVLKCRESIPRHSLPLWSLVPPLLKIWNRNPEYHVPSDWTILCNLYFVSNYPTLEVLISKLVWNIFDLEPARLYWEDYWRAFD